MFKSADVDGSEALSVHEIYTVVGSAASLKKQTGQLKKLLIVAVILIIVLMIGIAAMMVVILDAFKDTKASGAMLTTRDGAVMQTSPSLYPLPLLVAPVMSMAQLDAVQSLTVSYTDPQYISQNGTVQKVRVSAAVGNVVKVNETATYFELDSSDYKKVKVWNGEAQIELHNGNTYDVCESDVTCSALMVEDASQAETFLAQAQEALVNAGYASVAHAAERRRLSAYCVGYQMPDTEATSCLNTCPEHPTWVSDGWCDDGGPGSEYNGCSPGTDCDDCQKRDTIGCSNRCAYARNGVCDDGSQGAATNWCPVGTDCDDCGTGGAASSAATAASTRKTATVTTVAPGQSTAFIPRAFLGRTALTAAVPSASRYHHRHFLPPHLQRRLRFQRSRRCHPRQLEGTSLRVPQAVRADAPPQKFRSQGQCLSAASSRSRVAMMSTKRPKRILAQSGGRFSRPPQSRTGRHSMILVWGQTDTEAALPSPPRALTFLST